MYLKNWMALAEDNSERSNSLNVVLKRNSKLSYLKSKSKLHCDWQSVSKSWCRAPSGAYDQIFITVWQLQSCFFLGGGALSEERPGLKVKVTLWLTVSQSVSQSVRFGVKPHLGLMTRYLLLFDSYGPVLCAMPSLARGLVCLLYMLLALASAVFLRSESLGTRDHILLSQISDFHFHRLLRLPGSRWGIRPRLHMGFQAIFKVQSYIATDGQSVSKSWCRAPSGAHDRIFIAVWQLQSCFCGAPCLTRGRVCLLYTLLALVRAVFVGPSPLGLTTIFYCPRFETSLFVAFYDSQGHGGGIRHCYLSLGLM
jgi:hypothetical protein